MLQGEAQFGFPQEDPTERSRAKHVLALVIRCRSISSPVQRARRTDSVNFDAVILLGTIRQSF